MADTKIFDITISPQLVVTGEIDDADSVIPTTAVAGVATEITIATENTGNTEGAIYFELVENPNTSSQSVVNTQVNQVASGDHILVPTDITFPSEGTYSLGVKVWGEDEDEPAWGTANKTKIFSIAVSAPAQVTAAIDTAGSVIPTTGTVGESVPITISVKNTGDGTGDIYVKFVASPGAAGEVVIDNPTLSGIAPGASAQVTESFVPSSAGTFEYGVKVWGQDESEPPWGATAQTLTISG